MELVNKTIHELRDMLRSDEITSEQLVNAYYEQIEALDDKIGAYITLDKENALIKAKEIDAKRKLGEQLPDLAGIPMAIKDNICTKGVKTTCASRMLENFVPPYSATVVDKLESQGAIMLGKTNMDEFGMGGSNETSYFYPARNPWDLERVPGGSSGGSGAAVAAGEATFALGTDTGGSVRQPAASCGLVGLKPTRGIISRYGVVAISSSLDQVGPITKDVTDMALVLNTIVGHDPMDSISLQQEYPDYTKELNKGVKGLKIALPKEYFAEGINPEVKEAVLAAAEKLRDLGAIVEEVSMPLVKYALPAYYILVCAEASSSFGRFDGVAYGHRAKDYKDTAELYNKSRSEGFGSEVKRRIMLGTFALSAEHYNDYYKKAMQVTTLIKKQHYEIFEEYDVILSPIMPTTAAKLGDKGQDPVQAYLSDICTVNANIVGVPAISIPCGFDSNGLPIGMQLTGRAFEEQTILTAAYAFEQNTNFKDKKPALSRGEK